ncbi:MAG: nuclear transport factor 2 family protein [Pseudomonadota bacterium]
MRLTFRHTLIGLVCWCAFPANALADPLPSSSHHLSQVEAIIAAVNARDADAYVAVFAADAQVHMFRGERRIDGRDALRENRARHFARFPEVRNELVHLVAIDDRVVMHDRVKLTSQQRSWTDIVEVFTFEGGKIVRVDVLQPSGLFTQAQE